MKLKQIGKHSKELADFVRLWLLKDLTRTQMSGGFSTLGEAEYSVAARITCIGYENGFISATANDDTYYISNYYRLFGIFFG